ncbi:chemotaxis protein CheD [Pacificimonas flava]|uniref:Probable chemoreceptor glutamine deamidase CheD n=2 Tax=Pacificimonas TaxID=1960290 RepID=A0A219B5F2_9SPHN|nr:MULTISPECIES: chemotaxis protein CheD [Pacificimonas]MBZ6379203.1 chemotaxis protein CheD [Pacificimonas aurantium]OWV33577.1 chemotaxis protein CheD [Pacificimonas flava]
MARIPIIQGEYAVSDQPDTVITTILGSCVSVCLYDRQAKLGGMNHFLLGKPANDQVINPRDMQRYGVHAMELLINDLMRRGVERRRLAAHLYGGANMMSGLGRIGTDNAEFAIGFLEMEGITLVHTDLGGTCARKLEFMPCEGRARCIAVSADAAPPMRQPEAPKTGEVELF